MRTHIVSAHRGILTRAALAAILALALAAPAAAERLEFDYQLYPPCSACWTRATRA